MKHAALALTLPSLLLHQACSDGSDSVAGIRWGPDLVGLADDVDAESGEANDVALALFWNEEEASLAYEDSNCMLMRSSLGPEARLDRGTVTVHGGSAQASVQLAHNDDHYYYLEEPTDPFRAGDTLSVEVAEQRLGPIQVPTPYAEHNFRSLTSLSRSADTLLTFAGSDAAQVGVSFGLATATERYFFACVAPAGDGEYALPAAALDALPVEVEEVSLKLQPANLLSTEGLALITAGESVTVRLPLVD